MGPTDRDEVRRQTSEAIHAVKNQRHHPNKMHPQVTGETRMPYGKHKGTAIKLLPARYTTWLTATLRNDHDIYPGSFNDRLREYLLR